MPPINKIIQASIKHHQPHMGLKLRPQSKMFQTVAVCYIGRHGSGSISIIQNHYRR